MTIKKNYMFRDPNFSKKSYQNEYKTNNVRWAKYNMANRAYLDLSKSANNPYFGTPNK